MADDLLWFNIIHKEDQERVWEENKRTEQTGKTYKVEYRLHTRSGQIKWVHDESWLIRDNSGKPLFWQGFIIDITERKQIEVELGQRAAELSALQETVLNLTSRHSLPELLNLIVERATNLLNADSGKLYLDNNDEQMVTCVVSYNTPIDYSGTILRYGEGAAGEVIKTGKPLMIKNYSKWPGHSKLFDNEEILLQAVISVPLIWQGQVKGVLQLRRSDPFTRRDLSQLTMFANHAAVAVKNARLHE